MNLHEAMGSDGMAGRAVGQTGGTRAAGAVEAQRGANTAAAVMWQRSGIGRADRERRHGHASRVLWFTGLPGSGKSTLAFALERELHERGVSCVVLDGDNMRHGLCRELGFSEADRRENIRRVGEVAKLFMENGTVVLAALVSPGAEDRRMVREMFEAEDFAEVYVNCPLEECERRDPKGMYKKARSGLIPSFTGIGAPYDVPEQPELTVDTHSRTETDSVADLIGYLEASGVLVGRPGEAWVI